MSDSEDDGDAVYELTCAAPVNIALVKYWGKRDNKLIIPFNDSISLTLDEKKLGTETTIQYSTSFEVCKISISEI